MKLKTSYIKRLLICALAACPAILLAQGQENKFDVQLNKSFFKPGDTLKIVATQSRKKAPTATLFLLAENEIGEQWEMRWPMLNGRTEVQLLIPDSIPSSYYRLHFSVMQNLFTVFGKVRQPEKVTHLQSTLLTQAGDLYETETPVDRNGSFTYKNVLFLKDATLIFTLPEGDRKQDLDIQISTILDSMSFPEAGKTLQVYMGSVEPSKPAPQLPAEADSIFPKARMLEAVTVYTKPENRGDVFNRTYSRGLFKDMNERVINLLDDPFVNNALNPLQVVANRTAGFYYTPGINPRAIWRGQPVVFYIDEFRTDMQMADAVPMNDVAIIKVYPPPFIGNPGGSGGAVAIYTKRGGLSGDNFKNAFRVTGYTPLTAVFPAGAGE